jgi:hypothetical protein
MTSLMQWIKNHLLPAPTKSVHDTDVLTEKVKHALQVADQVTAESRSLNAKLEEYLKADRPFVAMLTDLHNRRAHHHQMSKWDEQ